jgi:hypothetical protein
MKKQIALALAGTAASIAGGLRLIQELVDRGSAREASRTGEAGEAAGGDSAASGPAASASTSREGIPDGATRAELYEIATKLNISGRSKMSKAELAEAINRA